MKRESTRRLMSLTGLCVAASLLASCEHKPPEPAVKDTLVQRTATVEAIDMPTRTVALRTEDGSGVQITAGPEVRNLGQVRVGDRVIVSYYQGVAAEVKPPGTAAQEPTATTSSVRTKPGERPAAGAAASLTTTVKVESVDTKNNIITFRKPDGDLRTLVVHSSEGQRFLAGLRTGDQVEVTYTEALAVEVRPASVAERN